MANTDITLGGEKNPKIKIILGGGKNLQDEIKPNAMLQQASAFWGLQEPSGQYLKNYNAGKTAAITAGQERKKTLQWLNAVVEPCPHNSN
jgi:hypothetical protein